MLTLNLLISSVEVLQECLSLRYLVQLNFVQVEYFDFL